MTANFWMIVSNAENFRKTQDLGFTVQGLKLQQRRKLQRVGTGDRVLFYVSGIRRFTATATVTSSYFQEETPIWDAEGCASWPYRIQIKPEISLEDAQYIDANMLAPRLEYVKRWPPENWYMAFQGNLHLLPKSDFLLIEEEMKKLRYGKDYKPVRLAPPPDGSRRKKSSSKRRKSRAMETVGAAAGNTAATGGDRPGPNPRAGVPAPAPGDQRQSQAPD
ncbi:MAG: EVE domain-containing protein [Chloroflexi bacterium]|nr:EVE domain-containing protein [Chloroflexota bacterium]